MRAYCTLSDRALLKQHHMHARDEGPIAGRTRSRTQHQTARKSPALNSTPSHKPTANKVTKPGKIHNGQAGSHIRKPISKRSQISASKRLCAMRLKLKEYLEGNEFLDYRGQIRFSTHQRIRQLSRVSPSGALGAIPNPLPTTVKSPERIEEARKRKLVGRSSLSHADRVLTDDEMEGEWGLLPGEVHENEFDFAMDMEVMEYATVDGNTLEALYEGYVADGVWRKCAIQQDEDVQLMAVRASSEEAWRARAREGAVMDVHCVTVVKSVWGMT